MYMEKLSFEVFEQLELDGTLTSEMVQHAPEVNTLEKIRTTLTRFLPGVEVSYDFENDETVLR